MDLSSLQDPATRMQNSGILEIRNRLGLISGGRVLDVGTSHGDFIGALSKSLKDYETFIGIDISEKDLEEARGKFQDERIRFEIMNAEEMSFDNSSFDTVCMSYSLHHLRNVELVLDEMRRVLKRGGHLIVQEMFSNKDQSEAKLTEIRIHHLDARVDRMNGVPHFETYSRQQLRDIVSMPKMSSVEVYESLDSLKCVFCDKMKECINPRSDENIKLGISEIDDILKRAEKLPLLQDITREAEYYKERVRIAGYESASQLFFICVK